MRTLKCCSKNSHVEGTRELYNGLEKYLSFDMKWKYSFIHRIHLFYFYQLTIDGSTSNDPDHEPNDHRNMTFYWFCRNSGEAALNIDNPDSVPVITIPTKNTDPNTVGRSDDDDDDNDIMIMMTMMMMMV